MGKSVLFLLAVAVTCSIILGVNNYRINNDIVGWQTRAQVSSEPNDMLLYMKNVQRGMQKWGMTHGHAAVFLVTPENDMSLIYRTVQQHIEQAEVLTTMDRSTPEYQTGLDNLRGSIRELDLHAHEYWKKNEGLLWTVLAWVSWILFLVLGAIWLEMN